MNGKRTRRLLAAVISVCLIPAAAAATGARAPEGPASGTTVPVPEMVAARRAVERLRAETLVTPPVSGRSGNLVRRLAALGPAGGPALLEVVREDGGLGATGDPARRLFVAAAVEALGQARLPEAAPAFRAILDGPGDDPRIARAAAAGLGKLCGEAEVGYLASLAAPGGRRAEAAVAGLGYCRVRPAAEVLVFRLVAAPDAEVARAMGSLGSSWAWEALGETRRAEGAAIRAELARALVAAFPGSEGELRTELGRAMVMVKAPETEALLAAARVAHPAEAEAIDGLLGRLAKGR